MVLRILDSMGVADLLKISHPFEKYPFYIIQRLIVSLFCSLLCNIDCFSFSKKVEGVAEVCGSVGAPPLFFRLRIDALPISFTFHRLCISVNWMVSH